MKSYQKRRLLRSQYQRKKSGASWWVSGLLVLGALGSLSIAAGIGALFVVYNSYATDYVPIDEKLSLTNLGLTEIYDRDGPDDGVLLGSLSNADSQLLHPVPLAQISPFMVEATISTEDNSFWTNPGINIRGLARAALENYTGGGIGSGSGGSSITQQLIKNVYICPSVGDEGKRCAEEGAERTVDRKLREIAYAIELEHDYSKEEILAWYLNQISYADRYIGVEAASRGYFRKPASELTLAEAALLAGIPSSPGRYHPRLNCAVDGEDKCIIDEFGRSIVAGDAKSRQEDVLDLMVIHGRASREAVEAAKKEELKVYPFTSELKAAAFIDNQVQPRLVRMCEAGLIEKLKGAANCEASVHGAGYKVTTTLDWAMTQKATEMIQASIQAGLDAGCDCHNAAIATIDPNTGEVVVYAANRDPSNTADPRIAGAIDQLTEINQPGSSFKPAVYLTWFDTLKKTPMSTFWDTSPLGVAGASITNPRGGSPASEGLISARAGLGGSQNVPAFRAASEAGVENVIAMAKKIGITTLHQQFDPTFVAHSDISYGASIATGGANIRVIDMAYMNSVFANMGEMVGVPHLATYLDPSTLKGTFTDNNDDFVLALEQKRQFSLGHIRLPGTRELDPIVVKEIRDKDGNVIFTQGEPERRQVVNAGSVWMLHSIMSDCTARFIIWGCGASNDDLRLDFFLAGEGTLVPAGVKTGTQQGPLSAVDTLETWTNGYSRYAATALWVGNATNELVRDGPAANYAAANTTVRLYKNWMGTYHAELKARGVFETPDGFASKRPGNVVQREFETPATDRTLSRDGKPPGGCEQKVVTWVRTDVKYESECEEKEIDIRNGLLASEQTPSPFKAMRKFRKLPDLRPDLAAPLAKAFQGVKIIPIAPTDKSTGKAAVEITNLTNGKTIDKDTTVVGSVQLPSLKSWRLEIGKGSNPTEWTELGKGTAQVSGGELGKIKVKDFEPGVYTVRLVAEGSSAGDLSTHVTINIAEEATPTPMPSPSPTPTPTPEGTPTPETPTVVPTATENPLEIVPLP